MKILLTVHQFFPDYRSGTEVLTYSVARELKKRGYEVAVLTGHPIAEENNKQFDEYIYEGIHVYRFYYRSPMKTDDVVSEVELRSNNSAANRYFMQICEAYKPDIVHFFHMDRLGSGLIDAAVDLGILAFMTPTDFWAICPVGQLMLCDGRLCSGPNNSGGNCIQHVAEMSQKNILGKLVKHSPGFVFDGLAHFDWVSLMPQSSRARDVEGVKGWSKRNIGRLNKLQKIVSPNSFMREKLMQSGISPDLIIDCAFGIEKNEREGGSVRMNMRKPLRIGYIGTLAQHKGCHILVEAFKKLPCGIATLSVYGGVEDFPEYVSMLKTLAAGGEEVRFHGTFPISEIHSVLEEMDVLVVPSLWYENTPLVVYAAQDAFCPVVASNLPGLSEMLEHDVNGLLFDAGKVDALADVLTRLIQEPELVGRLSKHARSPKSIPCYVDELLNVWSGDRS